MALLYEKYYKQKDKETFLEAVEKYAEKLGIPADWLMALMKAESGLNPKAKNSLGYVGLIQFGALTRKGLGVTQAQVLNMSGTNQMELVYKYFIKYASRGLINKFTDLYLITFYPNAGGYGGTLKKPDSWKFPEKVTKANKGIWTNKKIQFDDNAPLISKKSFEKWAESKISKEDRQKLVTKEKQIAQVSANKSDETNPNPERSEVPTGYFTYRHNYSDIKTLDDLISYKGWFVRGRSGNATGKELLDFEDNKISIRSAYSKRESKLISDGDLQTNLSVGAVLKIPNDWGFVEFAPFDSIANIYLNDDIETFISESMRSATSSPNYERSLKTITKGKIIKKMPRPRVWIWCKSLGLEENLDGNAPKYSSEGEIFDLSPFLMNVSTNVGQGGGSFSFSLPPLVCECSKDGWKIKKATLNEFSSNTEGERNFVAKNSVNHFPAGEPRRNTFLFHQMISSNDLVWISLDNPSTEPIDGLKDSLKNDIEGRISNTELPGRFWDMIGLVDSNSQTYSASGASIGITVSGRDLTKLLIEESSYHTRISETQVQQMDAAGLIVNDNPKNWGRPGRTNDVANTIFSLQTTAARTVGEMLSYIISNLAMIEVAPDSLFAGYQEQEEREEGFGISKYEFWNMDDNTKKTFKAAGIWQIIKLQIDNYAVNDRTVIENRLAVFSGSLIGASKMFVDGRFIELFGDTYLDQYFLMVRRPPYNRKCVFDYLDKITDSNSNQATDEAISSSSAGFENNGQTIDDSLVVSDNLSWFSGDVYAWYRISTMSTNSFDKFNAGNIFPMVFFREYCEIWGNKSLDVQSNYLPWNKIPTKTNQEDMESAFSQQLYEDLAYLVESNSYLPFTRQGTITLKGERRIKRGTWIRYAATGEVYYVDQVKQVFSINANTVERLTILTVSRGMVETNSSGQYILPLYFKIIDGLPNNDGEKKPEIVEEKVTKNELQVYFDFDKDVLIDPFRTDLSDKDLDDLEERKALQEKGEKELSNFVTQLIDNSDFEVKVLGHTDENGSDSYNLDLSRRRSKTIVNEIVKRWKLRTSSDDKQTREFRSRLSFVGKGEREPIKTNKGTSGSQRETIDAENRRIETEITIKSKKEADAAPKTEKENDFSKWKVNQSVFNFFKGRRQFCGHVDNLEEVDTPIESVLGSDLVESERVKRDSGKGGTNGSGTGEGSDTPQGEKPKEETTKQNQTETFLYQNEELLKRTSNYLKDVTILGRYEDEEQE